MSKRVHIAIIEPSEIIRSGVVAVLARLGAFGYDIQEISDLSSVTQLLKRSMPDITIVNPSHLGLVSPSMLRSEVGSKSMSIIALQSNVADAQQLKEYDAVISIYDSAETIKDKLQAIVEREDSLDDKKELSAREREVVVCIVKGMTNKQIADELSLSPHTIIAHRRNIAGKLNISTPAGLTIYAIVNKLVDLSEVKA